MIHHLRNIVSKLVFSLLIGLFAFCALQCAAQTADTTHVISTKDTVTQNKMAQDTSNASHADAASEDDSATFAMRPHPYQPNPKKSGMFSAILPGLGQAYNHQYWKVPVIYGGLGIAAYFLINNLKTYQSYREAYINRINNLNYVDQYTGIYLEPQLQQLQSDYSKYLDLTVLFTCLGYGLQVMDAITSAHLKNFDISRDISMKLTPVLYPNGAGMGLVMNFK